jgi:hypothetical protein
MKQKLRKKLREISGQLKLGEPVKSRLLLEIAGDMEESWQNLTASGLTAKEAEKKVCEKFSFSDSELGELTEVYLSPVQRLLGRLSSSLSSRFEKVLFVLVLMVVGLLSGRYFLRSSFFTHSNIFSYIATLCLITAVYVFLKKLFVLYVRRDFEITSWRNGVGLVAFCGLITAVCSFLVFLEKVAAIAPKLIILSKSVLSPLPLSEAGRSLWTRVMDWGIELGVLEINLLIMLMLTMFFWFVLDDRLQRIEQAEAELIMQVKT